MANLPDSGTINDFGGAGLINYANLPPSNPITDVDNTKLGCALSDISALKLVSARVAITFTAAATSGGLLINKYFSNWLNVNNTLPIVSRPGVGTYVFTLPSVVSDEYNNSIGIINNHTLNLQMILSKGFIGGTAFGFVNADVTAPNQVTIWTANASGVLSDFVGTNIFFTAR